MSSREYMMCAPVYQRGRLPPPFDTVFPTSASDIKPDPRGARGQHLATLWVEAEEAELMFRRTLSALILTAAVGGSALLPATAAAGERRPVVTVRFFDRDHRDYHRWNRQEELRYRAYLAERHRRYIAFRRADRQRQIAYWRWRHER
jgi:hypothetical protein